MRLTLASVPVRSLDGGTLEIPLPIAVLVP